MTPRKMERSDPAAPQPDDGGPQSRRDPAPAGAGGVLDRLQGAQARDLLLSQGNGQSTRLVHVQRYGGYMPYESMDLEREERKADSAAMTRSGKAATTAVAVHDQIVKKNGPNVVQLLTGHDAPTRAEIEREFGSAYGRGLRASIYDNWFSGWTTSDYLMQSGIYSLALLEDGHVHNLTTAVAMAVLPGQTRNTELDRILTTVNASGPAAIRELRQGYEKTFYWAGKGTLADDLAADLSGSAHLKAQAQIHHKLTTAEELYFETIGVVGTKTTAAANRLFAAWDAGIAQFAQLEQDWDDWVRNGRDWSTAPWTTQTLREAMLSEFTGVLTESDWAVLKHTFDGYDRYKAGLAQMEETGEVPEADYGAFFTDGPVDPALRQQAGLADGMPGRSTERVNFLQREAVLAIELKVAKDTFAAAAEAENTAQVMRAAENVGKIHDQRIAAAEATGEPDLIKKVKAEALTDRNDLKRLYRQEEDATSLEYQRARLLLEGSLTTADRVWLASKEGTPDVAIGLVTNAWAEGKLTELRVEAGKPRRAVERLANAVVVRPSYHLELEIPEDWGERRQRITTLYGMRSWEAQGANRLAWELSEGNANEAVSFLANPLLSLQKRRAIVSHYVMLHPADEPIQLESEAPERDELERGMRRFMVMFRETFPGTRAAVDMADLLLPAQKVSEMVERARERYEADAGWFAEMASAFTGEDVNEVAADSVKRLEFIAQNESRPNELAGLMVLMGVTSPLELGTKEYELLKSRLADIRAISEAVAGVLATLVDAAVKAFVAAVLAPLGPVAAAVISSMVGGAAGMLVKEAILQKEYQLFSEQNAFDLMKSGVNAFAGKVVKFGIPEEKLKAMGRTGAFMNKSIETIASETPGVVLSRLKEGGIVSGQQLIDDALAVLGPAASGSVGAAITRLDIDAVEGVRNKILANALPTLASGLTSETIAMAKGGITDLTPGDISARYANIALSSLANLSVETASEASGAARAPKVQAAIDDLVLGDILGAPGEGLHLGAKELIQGGTDSGIEDYRQRMIMEALVAKMQAEEAARAFPMPVRNEEGDFEEIPDSLPGEEVSEFADKSAEELLELLKEDLRSRSY